MLIRCLRAGQASTHATAVHVRIWVTHATKLHEASLSDDCNSANNPIKVLLQRLDVGNNRFAGKFNQLLGSLSFLISFSAERNMLSGTLPPTMASLGLKVCQQPTHHC